MEFYLRHFIPGFVFLLFIFFTSCEEEFEKSPPFIIHGKVFSESGSPLEGVVVNSIVDTVFTAADGSYSISAYPAGSIIFSKAGYESQIEAIRQREQINATLVKIPDDGSTQFFIRQQNILCSDGKSLDISVVEIRDFGQGIGSITLTRDKIWVLKNRVFVNEGQTLNIEPGTIIKAGSAQGESACALIVARGGKLIAKGLPEMPIIFTAEEDEILRGPDGTLCKPTRLSSVVNGRWGGVALLGGATVNLPGGEGRLGGIVATEPRTIFGGTDDDDNSGILEYVSIRHAGTSLGVENQLNGLTLAGVGRGTKIEHVEVYASRYDGFQFVGGSVNTRYLTASWCGDDAFDYTAGWRGMNQFWLAVQDKYGDRSIEASGNPTLPNSLPYSTPVIFNATLRGEIDNARKAISWQKNAGGQLHNSIVMGYVFGADIEYEGGGNPDSYQRLITEDLKIQRNLFFQIKNQPWLALTNISPFPLSHAPVAQAARFTESYFGLPENTNRYEDPQLNKLIPIPGGPAAKQGSIPESPFFEFTSYRGCFAPDKPRWIDSWTRIASDL